MNTAEKLAAAWRNAPPNAVHPEIDEAGRITGRAMAVLAVAELDEAVARYLGVHPSLLTILDYAAGPGRMAVELVGRWARVTLADTNRSYLELARDNLGDGDYDLLEVPPRPNTLPTVDVVFCLHLFLHLDHAHAGELLEVFARSVYPGGLVLVQIPVYDVGRPAEGWTAVGTYDEATVRTHAAHAGLEVLELHTNPGVFDYPGGANHHRLQIFRRPPA